MNGFSLSKAALVLCLAGAVLQTNVDLLNLKSHWVGLGVSVLYPKHLRLLSSKLTKQAGFMTTYNAFPAGDFWDMRGRLELKCTGSNKDSDDSDFGVGVFLTKNNPRASVSAYGFPSASALFGMSPALEGLSLVFNRNNLYTGLFKSGDAQRDETLARSKVCKAYLQKTGTVLFSVKYRTQVLGVYIGEEKEQFEHLCYQFTDMTDFKDFFLTVTASDKDSGCSAHLSDLAIESTNADLQFVANDQKKTEEYTLSYFAETENTKRRKEFDHFHKVYDFYRENAKVFAQSLLTFADFNEKEVMHEMKANVQKTEKAIDDAISIVELESRQIEALNNLLSSERRAVTSDVNETLEQILKWLSTMDGMFDKVDSETTAIHSMLSGLNFDEKLEALVGKVQRVGDSLGKAIASAKAIVKPSKLDDLDVGQISQWKRDIDGFQSKVNEQITSRAETKVHKLTQFFVWVLAVVALAVLVAFLVIYCKIQKAIRNKRML